MKREELTKYLEDYMEKCKSYDLDKIYNEININDKYPFFLQFIQLKEYYNFKKEFIDNLNSGNLSKKKEKERNESNEIIIGDKDNNHIIQNEYCLIDKKWIENWKKYVGYEEVIKNINNNKIKLKDYHWIKLIIGNYANKYPITSPDKIFTEKKINNDENFEIINERSYRLFSLKNEVRYFPMKLQKEKNILIINDQSFYIIFKEKKNQKYFEILINFEEESEEKKQLLDYFYHKDFNDFINNIKFDLYQDTDKSLIQNNCKIHIFNQTLKFLKETSVINTKQNGKALKNNLLSLESLDLINNETYRQIEMIQSTQLFKNRNDIENEDKNNIQNNNEENIEEKIEENNEDNNEDNNDYLNLNTMVEIERNISNKNRKNSNSNNNKSLKEPNNNNNTNSNNIKSNNINNTGNNLNNNNYNMNNNINNNENNNINNMNSNYNNINSNMNNNNINYLNNNNNIAYNNNINNYNLSNNINNNNNFAFNSNNQMNNNMMNLNYKSNINEMMNKNIKNNNNNKINKINYSKSVNEFININRLNINNNYNFQNNNNILFSNPQQNYNVANNYNNNIPNEFILLQQNMNSQNQNINCNFQINQCSPAQLISNNIKSNNFMNNMQNPSLNLKYPHKTGLKNLLQTCYMNATIQCLSNIKALTDYLLSHLGKFNVKEQPLITQYTNLLSELFYTKEKYVDPSLFKKVIGELNPLFQGLDAGDSKDLLFYILEAIHNELIPEQKIVINNKKDFHQLELESKDETKMLKNFFDDFNAKNKTKIYDIFYGITRSTMKCNKCKIIKYSFQMFNMQICQLKKIKEDKIAELGNFYNSNEKLNIFDAFLNQQKEEKLIQENMIYCNNCKGLQEGVHQQVIYGLPYVLIIILNRGRDNLDFNDEFIFPEILDLKNQGVVILNNNSYHKYYLCGIITHFGESGAQGHFTAYCRNSSTDKFTFYNDTVVTESSIEYAMKTIISDNSYEKKTPYILFYQAFE